MSRNALIRRRRPACGARNYERKDGDAPRWLLNGRGSVCRADNAFGGEVMRDIIDFDRETERTAWERLIAGIVYCAVLDYIENYLRSLRFKPNSAKRNEAYCEMYLIEKFFLSRWCALLTNDNGERILELTKKYCEGGGQIVSAAENRKPINAIPRVPNVRKSDTDYGKLTVDADYAKH